VTQGIVSTQRDGAVTHVVLNRPAVMNALNVEVLRALAAILDGIAEDATTRVVLLTGAGSKAFSAGADIGFLSKASAHEVRDFAALAVEVTRRIEALGKPVIAVLNGHALGGGLELAEACMLRIAEAHATLGHPEVQIGAVAGFGGTTRLPRLVGRTRAAEMLLTGRVVSASEALEIGLVNRVVETGAGIREAEALARELASRSAMALRLTWDALHRGMNLTLEESARLGADYFGLVAAGDEFREHTSRWLARKQKPAASDSHSGTSGDQGVARD
jgi:enoyl-CoA hydratase